MMGHWSDVAHTAQQPPTNGSTSFFQELSKGSRRQWLPVDFFGDGLAKVKGHVMDNDVGTYRETTTDLTVAANTGLAFPPNTKDGECVLGVVSMNVNTVCLDAKLSADLKAPPHQDTAYVENTVAEADGAISSDHFAANTEVMARQDMECIVDAADTETMDAWWCTNRRSTLIRSAVSMSIAAADAAQDLHAQLAAVQQALGRFQKSSSPLSALFGNNRNELPQHVQSLTKEVHHAQSQAMALLDLCLQNATVSERLREVLRHQTLELCLGRSRIDTIRDAFFSFRAALAAQKNCVDDLKAVEKERLAEKEKGGREKEENEVEELEELEQVDMTPVTKGAESIRVIGEVESTEDMERIGETVTLDEIVGSTLYLGYENKNEGTRALFAPALNDKAENFLSSNGFKQPLEGNEESTILDLGGENRDEIAPTLNNQVENFLSSNVLKQPMEGSEESTTLDLGLENKDEMACALNNEAENFLSSNVLKQPIEGSEESTNDGHSTNDISLESSPPPSSNLCDVRQRLTEAPITGRFWKWNGKFGWILPDEPIDHPMASRRHGRVYVERADLLNIGTKIGRATQCRFHAYTTHRGIGAEDCFVMSGLFDDDLNSNVAEDQTSTSAQTALAPFRNFAFASQWSSSTQPQMNSCHQATNPQYLSLVSSIKSGQPQYRGVACSSQEDDRLSSRSNNRRSPAGRCAPPKWVPRPCGLPWAAPVS